VYLALYPLKDLSVVAFFIVFYILPPSLSNSSPRFFVFFLSAAPLPPQIFVSPQPPCFFLNLFPYLGVSISSKPCCFHVGSPVAAIFFPAQFMVPPSLVYAQLVACTPFHFFYGSPSFPFSSSWRFLHRLFLWMKMPYPPPISSVKSLFFCPLYKVLPCPLCFWVGILGHVFCGECQFFFTQFLLWGQHRFFTFRLLLNTCSLTSSGFANLDSYPISSSPNFLSVCLPMSSPCLTLHQFIRIAQGPSRWGLTFFLGALRSAGPLSYY